MDHDIDWRMDGLLERFPELGGTGEARTTLTWFLGRVEQDGTLDRDWQEARMRMEFVNASAGRQIRLAPVDHDFWLCKRANPAPRPKNALSPFFPDYQGWSLQVWEPPAKWTQWPRFGVDEEAWVSLGGARGTRPLDRSFDLPGHLDGTEGCARGGTALAYLDRDSAGAAEKLVVTQSVAWLDTALGRIGRLRTVHENVEPRVLLEDLITEILPRHSTLRADMMEDCVELLYGSARSPDGKGLLVQPSPRGQSHEWRDYFRALGHDVPREAALVSVQLAALLLRSEPVWAALANVRRWDSDDAGKARDLATAVRRRWYLALRSLAWLELSLLRPRPYDVLLPTDLACFAITSLLPLYPRPLVVVSHRSRDAKERLLRSRLWGSHEVLLDATFRPEWQTNRAMVWSLFASTPVICRLRSPGYGMSRWCRAESEMIDHLLETADFLTGRRCMELELEDASLLEGAVRTHSATHRYFDTVAGVDSPPFELLRWTAWQAAMVRAVAIARFTYRVLAMANLQRPEPLAELTNRVLEQLCDPASEPVDASLLGFDDLWKRLADGLRADAAVVALDGPLARITAEEALSDVEAWFQRHREWIPDPSGTGLELCDLLAALDWRDHLEHYLRGHNEGTQFQYQAAMVDLRGATEEEWVRDPGWTVARGLIFLRLPYPLLVRQHAGQGVDGWPLIRELDLPVFTQHAPEQYLPHSEVFFSLGGPWPAAYFNAVSSTVELSPYLVYACRESLTEDGDPVMMRFDKPLSSFKYGGRDFLEWLEQRGESKA